MKSAATKETNGKVQEVLILREGFWLLKGDKTTAHLPRPVSRKLRWTGKKKFVLELKAVMKHDKVQVEYYRGFSLCRCCGIINGSAENTLRLLGLTWQWPVGYLHYIEEHNVRPSLAFQEFIAKAYEHFYTE